VTFRTTIYVPRESYRGNDPKRRAKLSETNRLADRIQSHLQSIFDEMEPGEIRSIMSYSVARALNEDPEAVRRIIFRIDGGSNGVTFKKPEIDGLSHD
jgi:hypothetical protein